MKASHKAILGIAIPTLTITFLVWWDFKKFLIGLLASCVLFLIAMIFIALYRAVLDKIEDIEDEKRRAKEREEWEERKRKEGEERRRRMEQPPSYGSGSYHTQPEVKVTFRSSKPTTDSY